MLNKVKKERARLEQLYERAPSEEEIADALQVPKEKLLETILAGSNTMSADAPLVQDEDMCLMDVLEQDSAEDTDSIVMKESLNKDIKDVLATLSEQEREIIYMYFGLGQSRPLTLDEIAEKNNITRERVRKIKERALNRLRNNEKTQKLAKYLCQ